MFHEYRETKFASFIKSSMTYFNHVLRNTSAFFLCHSEKCLICFSNTLLDFLLCTKYFSRRIFSKSFTDSVCLLNRNFVCTAFQNTIINFIFTQIVAVFHNICF